MASTGQQAPGPATDAQGRVTVDPTRNVLDLVSAAIKRQDDMREAWQDATQRELNLRQQMRENELQDLRELLETRLNAMDVATGLRIGTIAKFPTDIEKQIEQHTLVQEERFHSIALQFQERDIRTEQANKASTEALAAALQAAKELVGAQGEASAAAAIKSETSFTKQLDQVTVIIESKDKATDARVTELKERIDRGEGVGAGIASNKAGMYALAGFILTVLVIINVLAVNGVLGGT